MAVQAPAAPWLPSSDGGVLTAALASEDPIIEVDHVWLRFGGVTSLADVTMSQRRGEILAVIGPNGAGKTSLFNCLTGVYKPNEGSIVFHPVNGAVEPLNNLPKYRYFGPHTRALQANRINNLGIARTFQASRLFNALTAFENVKIGAEARQRTGPVGAMLHLPRRRREERESDRRAEELLGFVGLRDVANELASSLPYGAQRRLEIARALATGPELLLLDEPAAGTNPSEKVELATLIGRVNSELGVSVLLIEHDMRLVMSLAERIVVLNFGAVISAGTPAQVQRDAAVIEAYLGRPADDAAGTSGPAEVSPGTGSPPTAGASSGAHPCGTADAVPPAGASAPARAAERRVEPDGSIPDPFVEAESWPIVFPDDEQPGSFPPEER